MDKYIICYGMLWDLIKSTSEIKKKCLTLRICNENICFKIKIIFKFKFKLCFMLLYSMKCFAMINGNLVISYKIVFYTTCMSLNAMLYIDICCKRCDWADCITQQYVFVVHLLTQLQ